jgi:hypothetical protein
LAIVKSEVPVRWIAFVFALLLAAGSSQAAPVQKVAEVPFAGGSQTVLYVGPLAPTAIVISFTGGAGQLKIAPDGRIGISGNFLVRTRELWVQRGLGVLIPDLPAGYSNLFNRRNTPEYADAIAKLVAFAKAQANVPVWLMGTSQGTNAAANGGATLTHGEIAGVVLTASITRPGGKPQYKETVFDNRLAVINVPVLIVSHGGDGCMQTPPGDGSRIKAALRASPRSEVVLMSGGLPAKSDACEAFSEHGFYGVEAETVQRIVDWMRGR